MENKQEPKKHLLLFDIDGTLTAARKEMGEEIRQCLLKMQEKFDLAVVGGSDRVKQLEQLGSKNLDLMVYYFAENGTDAFDQDGKGFHTNSIKDSLGEEKFKKFCNHVLRVLSETDGIILLMDLFEDKDL